MKQGQKHLLSLRITNGMETPQGILGLLLFTLYLVSNDLFCFLNVVLYKLCLVKHLRDKLWHHPGGYAQRNRPK